MGTQDNKAEGKQKVVGAVNERSEEARHLHCVLTDSSLRQHERAKGKRKEGSWTA